MNAPRTVAKLREFLDRVTAHPELVIAKVKSAPDLLDSVVTVAHGGLDERFTDEKPVVYEVGLRAIIEHPWDEIEDVLTGRRRPRIMSHVARIVGYYSNIRNWNRSKLAELRDRQKGEYAVPEAT